MSIVKPNGASFVPSAPVSSIRPKAQSALKGRLVQAASLKGPARLMNTITKKFQDATAITARKVASLTTNNASKNTGVSKTLQPSEQSSRTGVGSDWPKGRGVAILGATGGIGGLLNASFQTLATVNGEDGPSSIVTVGRGDKQKPDLKDPGNPAKTLYSTSLAPHADKANDVFSTASVPMSKNADGTLNRAGMLAGNVRLMVSAAATLPQDSVMFNATNPSHTLATMVGLLRPDVTPVGHAGTDVNRAVALTQLGQRTAGQSPPVVIGDHGPSMGAWDGDGGFLARVPDRGSMHASNNNGQTMQSQTAQALIGEAKRFHSNESSVLALPLTVSDAAELSARLGMDVPEGMVATFPMTAEHTVDFTKVDALLDNTEKQKTRAAALDDNKVVIQPTEYKTNREVIVGTIASLIDQRQDAIDGLHVLHDSLVLEKESNTDPVRGSRLEKELEIVAPVVATHPRRDVYLR